MRMPFGTLSCSDRCLHHRGYVECRRICYLVLHCRKGCWNVWCDCRCWASPYAMLSIPLCDRWCRHNHSSNSPYAKEAAGLCPQTAITETIVDIVNNFYVCLTTSMCGETLICRVNASPVVNPPSSIHRHRSIVDHRREHREDALLFVTNDFKYSQVLLSWNMNKYVHWLSNYNRWGVEIRNVPRSFWERLGTFRNVWEPFCVLCDKWKAIRSIGKDGERKPRNVSF